MEEKSFAELQGQRVRCIDFNDRNKLLKLIEYTRNSSPGYGITNILDNFMNDHPNYHHSAIVNLSFKEKVPSFNFTTKNNGDADQQ